MIKTSIIVVTEFVKILLSLVILVLFETKESRRRVVLSFDFRNSLMYAALPAICYAVQNLLTQYGYDKIDGTTFNILNQTKVRRQIKYYVLKNDDFVWSDDICCILFVYSPR